MATLKKMIKSAPRMRGVTPVPNGPLIKKKGEFKGSSLKKGGVVKAQAGVSKTKSVYRSPDNTYKTVIKTKSSPGMEKKSVKETRTIKGFLKGVPTVPKVMKERRENAPLIKEQGPASMIAKRGKTIKKAQNGDSTSVNKQKFMNGLYDIAKSNSQKAKTTPRFNNPLDRGKSLSEQNGEKDLEQFRKFVSKQKNGGKLKIKYKK